MGNALAACHRGPQDSNSEICPFLQPFAEELVNAVPVLSNIFNAMKTIYTKYEEHHEMKDWLKRVHGDVEMTAAQAAKLPLGLEHTMLEEALCEACVLLKAIGNGSPTNAKDDQRRLQDIKTHLNQCMSSAHLGLSLKQCGQDGNIDWRAKLDPVEQYRISVVERKAFKLGIFVCSYQCAQALDEGPAWCEEAQAILKPEVIQKFVPSIVAWCDEILDHDSNWASGMKVDVNTSIEAFESVYSGRVQNAFLLGFATSLFDHLSHMPGQQNKALADLVATDVLKAQDFFPNPDHGGYLLPADALLRAYVEEMFRMASGGQKAPLNFFKDFHEHAASVYAGDR